MSLLAIGSSLELDALSTLGFEVMKISKILSEDEREEILGRVVTSKLVIIEEEIYKQLKDRLRDLLKILHSPPLIVVVPTLEKNKTYRLEELHDIISHAVGVRLKWKR